MRLYQKPCARVNSGFEDLEGEKLEFKISHYGVADRADSENRVKYVTCNNLIAKYIKICY